MNCQINISVIATIMMLTIFGKWEFYLEICRSSPYILKQNSIFVGIIINEVYLSTYTQQYLP